MTEKEDTIILANKILDRISEDPDDDLAMLSRQFLRSLEEIARLKSLLTRSADALEDLVWKERLHQPLIDELRKAAE